MAVVCYTGDPAEMLGERNRGSMINVIDYRAGNAPSVLHALHRLGLPGHLVTTPAELAGAERIILPGVGAARATLDSLQETGCLPVLRHKVLEERVPFLGICIGLQILFDHSEEEDTPGLGWLPGRVQRFAPAALPVPQIGWNEVRLRPHPVLRELPASGYFYFVNSYHAVPDDDAIVYGTADYGGDFCALVAQDNIVAAQFHVEKSGPLGLRLLRAFATVEQEALCSPAA